MPNLANNCSSVGVATYSDFIKELFAASMGGLPAPGEHSGRSVWFG